MPGIFTDGVHVISTVDLNHLHDFMASVGVKRCWYHQDADPKHYDLPKRRRNLSLAGATLVSSRDLVKLYRERYG